MNLIKSKVNSLAWLNSAICVSVVGGVVLSSTPVLAAYLVPLYDDPTRVAFWVKPENSFRTAESTVPYGGQGTYWQGTVQITQHDGSEINGDDLLIRVYLQHRGDPHSRESGPGGRLDFNFRSTSRTEEVYKKAYDTSRHPGTGHVDVGEATLAVYKLPYSDDNTHISDWRLEVSGEHKVPEPTTMFGTAVALGWVGWMKRKNSIKQDKTKSQG
jgi:hypothetical protein